MFYDHGDNMNHDGFANEQSEGQSNSGSSNSGQKAKTSVALRCPVCSNLFHQEETTAMPFCSVRCKQVDLGRWLNESYGLPYEGEGVAEGFGPREDMEPD